MEGLFKKAVEEEVKKLMRNSDEVKKVINNQAGESSAFATNEPLPNENRTLVVKPDEKVRKREKRMGGLLDRIRTSTGNKEHFTSAVSGKKKKVEQNKVKKVQIKWQRWFDEEEIFKYVKPKDVLKLIKMQITLILRKSERGPSSYILILIVEIVFMKMQIIVSPAFAMKLVLK